MADRDQASKEIANEVTAWEDVLYKTDKDKKLWFQLEEWWTGIVNNHEGIDSSVRTMHINSLKKLKAMDSKKVNQMLVEYKKGDYPDEENLERESIIHLFIAIIQNHHKLW